MGNKTPRQRFVEAMRVLARLPGYQNAKDAAADAFADQECVIHPKCIEYGDPAEDTLHESCRAALRAEIRGEK